jgi:hypothetical protein
LWEKSADKFYNNIAADLKPGDVLPWAHAIYQHRKKQFGRESMETQCLPDGPAIIATPYVEARIIQTPSMLAMLESDLTYRQIFMDGRKLEKDPNPTWMGYAVGHWEGDTLVVESNGYKDRSWLDGDGHPHTEALRITERYHRPDFGHIDLQVTVDDPGTFTKPFSVAIKMTLHADTEMLEYVCDNEKDRAHIEAGVRAAPAAAPVVDAGTLARYAGVYEAKDDGKLVPVEIIAEGGGLLWNYNGEGRQRLEPVSEKTWSLAGRLFEFEDSGNGPVQRFLIKAVEDEIPAVRRK